MKKSVWWWLPVLMCVAACGAGSDDDATTGVRSHLAGELSVRADVDSTRNYGDFELIVAHDDGDGEADTLGIGQTDSTGAFAFDVVAPERGVYPLLISRGGRVVHVAELVVADGDSAFVKATLPMGRRPLNIRSVENAAWMAYRNAHAQYEGAVRGALAREGTTRETLAGIARQTSAVLWSLRDNFPGTIGADLGEAESLMLVEGWNDSLVVARSAEIRPANPRYVDAARTARRATARLEGQTAAIALLRRFQERAERSETRAALQAEIVAAHMDSLEQSAALAAARRLKNDFGDSDWGLWADRAVYEIEHLMPGMEAPALEVTTREGETLSLASLRGRPVIVEYFVPGEQTFMQELPTRNALAQATAETVTIVSISLQPDTSMVDAFLSGRDLPGYFAIAPGGADDELARRYNVTASPTRVLIDADGTIVGKYVGGQFGALWQALAQRIGA